LARKSCEPVIDYTLSVPRPSVEICETTKADSSGGAAARPRMLAKLAQCGIPDRQEGGAAGAGYDCADVVPGAVTTDSFACEPREGATESCSSIARSRHAASAARSAAVVWPSPSERQPAYSPPPRAASRDRIWSEDAAVDGGVTRGFAPLGTTKNAGDCIE
jgi:hypothetical protein